VGPHALIVSTPVSTRAASEQVRDRQELQRVLAACRQLEREIIELEYVRRSDAVERVGEAVRRLGEVGSPEGILDRAAEELGHGSQFDRVLISKVLDNQMCAHALWMREPESGIPAILERLQRDPVVLDYPLIEADVARQRVAARVTVASARSRTPALLADVFGWPGYVVAPVAVGGNTIGLLHADTAGTGRLLDALDDEVMNRFCDGLAAAFERAALRDTLRRHRTELQAAVQWMSGRLGRLAADAAAPAIAAGDATSRRATREALTPRELEVLRLMARGRTNQAIANALVVRVGTVKYHVKNILRKLGATSRADAVSRYARGSGTGR
jgi:LuxR family transcriptional regulator, regulator of acetate metabolism